MSIVCGLRAQPKDSLVVLSFVFAVLFPIVGLVGFSRSDHQRNKYAAAAVLGFVMLVVESLLAWIVLSFVADVLEGLEELGVAGF